MTGARCVFNSDATLRLFYSCDRCGLVPRQMSDWTRVFPEKSKEMPAGRLECKEKKLEYTCWGERFLLFPIVDEMIGEITDYHRAYIGNDDIVRLSAMMKTSSHLRRLILICGFSVVLRSRDL